MLQEYVRNGSYTDCYSTTVTDEATFTEPVVRRGFMAWEPGEVVKPFNCTLTAEGDPCPTT